MEYGVTLPVAGPLATTEALAAVATRAEALGFTSLWVTDHIAMPLSIQSPYPYTADRRAWDPTIPCLDAFTALTWAAAVTRRVRLGTSVLVLPMRQPLAVAKTVGTLDYLSGGRVILGVGAGWLEEEFALLGQSFRDRGRRIVEGIRVLKASWAGDPVRPTGERFAEKALVFGQDLRVPAVAETLEERGRPLDVGEEEGDRPGRQAGQERPPWARMSR